MISREGRASGSSPRRLVCSPSMGTTFLAGCAAAAAAVLAAAALAQDSGDAMMAGRASGRVIHDPAYFRDRVLPLLDRHCVECHEAADKKNETKNRLVGK